MVSYFLKKITLLNIGILIIVFRIFGLILVYVNRETKKNSIFPKTSENGYPFQDSINYNIEDIKQVIYQINESFEKNTFNKNLFIPNFTPSQNICGFFDSINFCKNLDYNNNINIFEYDDKCLNDLYYKRNIMNLYNKEQLQEKIISLIQDKNQFNNNKEIILFHSLINGYNSYLTLLNHIEINKNNLNFFGIPSNLTLITKIVDSSDSLNDLFYLYTLYLIYYTKLENINKNIKINKLLEYHEEEIIKEIKNFSSLSDSFDKIFNKEIIPSIYCLPDIILSYNTKNIIELELSSLKTLLHFIFSFPNKRKIPEKEQIILKYFIKQLTFSIQEIFNIDDKIKLKSNFFKKYQNLFFILYWLCSIIFGLYFNKNFLKHKEYYSSKTRLLENTNKTREFKKMKKYVENLRKLQENGKILKNRNKNSKQHYSKEEMEYIEKLTKNEGDNFIINK